MSFGIHLWFVNSRNWKFWRFWGSSTGKSFRSRKFPFCCFGKQSWRRWWKQQGGKSWNSLLGCYKIYLLYCMILYCFWNQHALLLWTTAGFRQKSSSLVCLKGKYSILWDLCQRGHQCWRSLPVHSKECPQNWGRGRDVSWKDKLYLNTLKLKYAIIFITLSYSDLEKQIGYSLFTSVALTNMLKINIKPTIQLLPSVKL